MLKGCSSFTHSTGQIKAPVVPPVNALIDKALTFFTTANYPNPGNGSVVGIQNFEGFKTKINGFTYDLRSRSAESKGTTNGIYWVLQEEVVSPGQNFTFASNNTMDISANIGFDNRASGVIAQKIQLFYHEQVPPPPLDPCAPVGPNPK